MLICAQDFVIHRSLNFLEYGKSYGCCYLLPSTTWKVTRCSGIFHENIRTSSTQLFLNTSPFLTWWLHYPSQRKVFNNEDLHKVVTEVGSLNFITWWWTYIYYMSLRTISQIHNKYICYMWLQERGGKNAYMLIKSKVAKYLGSIFLFLCNNV